MPATLDPNEVDALMQAIKTGDVPTSEDEAAGPIATLYDLTSQDRIIRGQLPTLDAMNDRIASRFASGLTGRIRTQVNIASNPSTLLKFVDFNALLAPTATVGVLSLGSSYGLALVVLETGLAEALLAGALGDKQARGESPQIDGKRELTSIERMVLRRLINLFNEAMADVWKPILPLTPKVQRWESDPRLAIIAPSNEVAVLSTFELSGALEGTLQLGIPYSAVESVKNQLSSPPRTISTGDNRFALALTHELQEVEVEISVELGQTEMTLNKLLGLKVGDVLQLNTDERSLLPLYVEGRKKLAGLPKVINSSMGFMVQTHIKSPFSRLGTKSAISPENPPAESQDNDSPANKPSEQTEAKRAGETKATETKTPKKPVTSAPTAAE